MLKYEGEAVGFAVGWRFNLQFRPIRCGFLLTLCYILLLTAHFLLTLHDKKMRGDYDLFVPCWR